MEINAYNQSYGTSSINNSSDLKVQKESSNLDMDDFLNLLVSQMTNQDVMNPMDNTEFVAQLAQFSSLQAMTNMSEISKQGQATSLIGKNVIMAKYNNKGEMETDEGIVEKVTIHSGITNLYVNGKTYEMSNVMEIKLNTPDTASTTISTQDQLNVTTQQETEI